MGKVIYHQRITFCGKSNCRKCRDGAGHGPYWYAHRTVNGHTTRTYVGKQLPPEVRSSAQDPSPLLEPSLSSSYELADLRVYTLGRFRFEYRKESEWRIISDSALQTHLEQVLVSFLVSSVGRKVARETVAQVAWSPVERLDAANRLDKAIQKLQKLFDVVETGNADSPLLLVEHGLFTLADQHLVWIDADAFEHTIIRAFDCSDPSKKERLLEEAVLLYEGHFLPEEHKIEVVLERRATLQKQWIRTLLEMSELRVAREALPEAIEPLRQLLSLDPTHEEAVRRLMRVLGQLGQQVEAMRVYNRLAKVLRLEHALSPLPETRVLYDAVRASATFRDSSQVQRHSPSYAAEKDASGKRSAPGGDGSPSPPKLESSIPALQVIGPQKKKFVGREQEFGIVHDLLLAAERSLASSDVGTLLSPLVHAKYTPQCALLLGEAGIGKTRLVEEFERVVRKRNWLVAWGRYYEHEKAIPYGAWTDILRQVIGRHPDILQEVRTRPVLYQPIVALLPELHSTMLTISASQSLSSEQEKRRLLVAVRELLTKVSEQKPLLVVLDDLQWSDSGSCELLAYLARRTTGFPLMLIGTSREHELLPDHPLRLHLVDLQREEALQTLVLHPLDDERIGELLLNMLLPTPLPDAARMRIQSLAAGNPYFAEELARMEHREDEAPAARGGAMPGEVALPESIKEFFDLRLHHLSTACQQMLRKAVILGPSFDLSLLCSFVASEPGLAVVDLLEEAKQLGVLTEERKEARTTYHFYHPLLVKYLYQSLSATRREHLGRRVMRIVQEQSGS